MGTASLPGIDSEAEGVKPPLVYVYEEPSWEWPSESLTPGSSLRYRRTAAALPLDQCERAHGERA